MTTVTVEQAMRVALQHHEAGQLQQAEQLYRQILAEVPEHAPALHGLGLIAYQLGQNDIAVDLIRRAILLRPDAAEAHNNLGLALKDRGQLDEAIAAYRRAIALRPNYAEAHSNLGLVLTDKGQLDEAIAAYRRAIALRPNLPEIHNNLGIALGHQRHFDEAITAYRQAIRLRSNYADAHSNLGNALTITGQPDEAIVAYRQAIAIRPTFADAYSNLAGALKDQGKLDESLAAYKEAMALKPTAPDFHGNVVYTICFHSDYDPQRILQEARGWARQHAEPLAVHIVPHDNDRSPDRPIRVGYVSPNFRDHVVGRNVLPILENHDRGQFQIHCFSSVRSPDSLTGRFRQIADRWHETTGINDADLADLVRRQRIDILVDLNLHMAGSRLLTFARKPSPVQVTWAGYPGTTGLNTIDYRLTDRYLDPPGEGDECYSEKSIRLPHSFWCFRPAADTPEINPLPALSTGIVTFGCLNNFCKVTAPAMNLWANVLKSVVNSRLLLLCPLGSRRQHVLHRFEASGLDARRLEFVNPAPLAEYLRRYHIIDIALDPLPYTGHSTSLDALWMGVPVVTLPGTTVASRGGVSIASNLGMPELIARTEEQYIETAARLAGDLQGLAELRKTLRHRMRNSPLMDERRFTLDVERAYRQMWRHWCSATS